MNRFTVHTPLVTLGITTQGGTVTSIRFHDDPGGPPRTALEQLVAREMGEYFGRGRSAFTFPYHLEGSEFQRRTWEALLAIPYGKTCSYADIARAIGQPGATQAVGMANHHNPVPLVVPCHRVIAADGSLGGFGGGPELKRRLLELEGATDSPAQLPLW